MLDERGRLLHAALGFALVPLLARWLDTWRGIDDIVAGNGAPGLRPRATAL
jgi:hypothetical protein